jgi:hypothetical protein
VHANNVVSVPVFTAVNNIPAMLVKEEAPGMQATLVNDVPATGAVHAVTVTGNELVASVRPEKMPTELQVTVVNPVSNASPDAGTHVVVAMV